VLPSGSQRDCQGARRTDRSCRVIAELSRPDAAARPLCRAYDIMRFDPESWSAGEAARTVAQ
jgi:hypothetical protein